MPLHSLLDREDTAHQIFSHVEREWCDWLWTYMRSEKDYVNKQFFKKYLLHAPKTLTVNKLRYTELPELLRSERDDSQLIKFDQIDLRLLKYRRTHNQFYHWLKNWGGKHHLESILVNPGSQFIPLFHNNDRIDGMDEMMVQEGDSLNCVRTGSVNIKVVQIYGVRKSSSLGPIAENMFSCHEVFIKIDHYLFRHDQLPRIAGDSFFTRVSKLTIVFKEEVIYLPNEDYSYKEIRNFMRAFFDRRPRGYTQGGFKFEKTTPDYIFPSLKELVITPYFMDCKMDRDIFRDNVYLPNITTLRITGIVLYDISKFDMFLNDLHIHFPCMQTCYLNIDFYYLHYTQERHVYADLIKRCCKNFRWIQEKGGFFSRDEQNEFEIVSEKIHYILTSAMKTMKDSSTLLVDIELFSLYLWSISDTPPRIEECMETTDLSGLHANKRVTLRPHYEYQVDKDWMKMFCDEQCPEGKVVINFN